MVEDQGESSSLKSFIVVGGRSWCVIFFTIFIIGTRPVLFFLLFFDRFRLGLGLRLRRSVL